MIDGFSVHSSINWTISCLEYSAKLEWPSSAKRWLLFFQVCQVEFLNIFWTEQSSLDFFEQSPLKLLKKVFLFWLDKVMFLNNRRKNKPFSILLNELLFRSSGSSSDDAKIESPWLESEKAVFVLLIGFLFFSVIFGGSRWNISSWVAATFSECEAGHKMGVLSTTPRASLWSFSQTTSNPLPRRDINRWRIGA